MFRKVGIIFSFAVLLSQGVFAQNQSGFQAFLQRLTKPDVVGGGLVATHLDAMGKGSAFGPGLEGFVRYNLSPKAYAFAGTGFLSVMDKTMSTDVEKITIFPTLDLGAGYNLTKAGRLTPSVYAGLQLAGWKYSNKVTGLSTATAFDAGLLFGGNMHYAMNDRMGMQFSGGIKNLFTASMPYNHSKSYWVAKVGISYALSGSSRVKGEEIEYLFDDDGELALDDLFKEDKTGRYGDNMNEDDALDVLFAVNDEEDALASLFSGDNSSSGQNSYFNQENASASASDYDSYSNSEISSLMARVGQLKNDMENRSLEIESLQDQVRKNERLLANISGNAAGGYSSYSGSFGVQDDTNFKATYQVGLERFNAKQYNEAIQVFQGLLASSPDHRLASNCRYWIGESYNAMGNFSAAIQAFSDVLNYKASYKFDDALIMRGICYMKIGNNDVAREQFQELVSRYPDSEYAPKAMRYLGRL